MKTLYTAHASTVAGRGGHTATDDKKIDLDLSPPGSNGAGSNPEQLFACGYSACFGSAVEAVAKKEQVALKQITIHAEVALHQDEEKGFFISVGLNAQLDGVDDATALRLVEKAHQVCPYSKATRGNIEVRLQANSRDVAAKAA
jgi:Ohr subfamily peroxiredoxin